MEFLQPPSLKSVVYIGNDEGEVNRFGLHRRCGCMLEDISPSGHDFTNIQISRQLDESEVKRMIDALKLEKIEYINLSIDQFKQIRSSLYGLKYGMSIFGKGEVRLTKGEYFKDMQYLWLEAGTLKCAKEQVPSLRSLSTVYSKQLESLFPNEKLRMLSLLNCPADLDSTVLKSLTHFEIASFRDTRLPISIQLPKLQYLSLHTIRHIEDIGSLSLCPNLHKLKIYYCPLIKNLEPIFLLSKLKFIDVVGCKFSAKLVPRLESAGMEIINFS